MKINVALSAALRREADAAAKELGVPLTKPIRMALEEFLKQRRDEAVTAALNRSYKEHPPEIDPFLQYLALEGMKRMEREENEQEKAQHEDHLASRPSARRGRGRR